VQKIYRREEWEAVRSNGTSNILNPTVGMALLSHTITDPCNTFVCFLLNSFNRSVIRLFLQTYCSLLMRSMQRTNMETSGLFDYAFNFAVGGDGLVFEGRGWDIAGAHTSGLNTRSIGIAVIGDFRVIEPSQGMLDSLGNLLENGEALGKLTSDFRIYGRQDFDLAGPGDAFMKHVRDWCRYGNRTTPCDSSGETTTRKREASTTTSTTSPAFTTIIESTSTIRLNISNPEFMITRDEWGANYPNTGISRLSLPIKRIIVAHTGGESCSNEVKIIFIWK
jgi:hypothetical protein